jgi:hypothetical protein
MCTCPTLRPTLWPPRPPRPPLAAKALNGTAKAAANAIARVILRSIAFSFPFSLSGSRLHCSTLAQGRRFKCRAFGQPRICANVCPANRFVRITPALFRGYASVVWQRPHPRHVALQAHVDWKRFPARPWGANQTEDPPVVHKQFASESEQPKSSAYLRHLP